MTEFPGGQKWRHFSHVWSCLVWVLFTVKSYCCTVGLCGLDGLSSIHVFVHWNNVWSDLLLAHVLSTFERVINSFWPTKTEQSVVCLVALAR